MVIPFVILTLLCMAFLLLTVGAVGARRPPAVAWCGSAAGVFFLCAVVAW